MEYLVIYIPIDNDLLLKYQTEVEVGSQLRCSPQRTGDWYHQTTSQCSQTEN